MTIIQSTVFGLVQGLSEFLPISSSAHLTLIPAILKWKDPGLSFDVALHIGTLTAVVIFFFKDWLKLIKAGFLSPGTPDCRMFWNIIIATIPGGIIGVLFDSQAEHLFRNPILISTFLIVMAVILYIADRKGARNQSGRSLTTLQTLVIGSAQALAIIPGISRSGITMTAGLIVGLNREEAAKTSFLLSTPIIVGAGLLKARYIVTMTSMVNVSFYVGVITSAITGLLVIGTILKWLKKQSFVPFAIYRVALGLSVIMLSLSHKL